MIAVRCPACRRPLHVTDDQADRPLRCSVCGAAFVAARHLDTRASQAGAPSVAEAPSANALPSAPSVPTANALPSAPSVPKARVLPSAPSVPKANQPSEGARPYPFLGEPERADELGRLGGFRVLRVLGQGGMGVVFEAEDVALRRHVALKVMRPEAAAHPQGRERFLREARAAAGVTHDHIIPIHQVGEERGAPFLVMPLLKGETLEKRLERDKRLPVREALRIAREVAEGLAAAHEAGLVHRDVKPANVWLEAPAGRVKLLDFGLARAVDERLTKTGALLGTPAYMAPEQAGGKPDHRADLFSLGAVLYEMLTGRRAFEGDDWLGTLKRVALHKPKPPHVLIPAVPEELSGLVMELLAKKAADRPPTARAVAQRLREREAPRPAPPSVPVSPPVPALTTGGGWSRRLGVAVALALLVPLAWALWPRGKPPPAEPTPQVPSRTEGPGPRLSQAEKERLAEIERAQRQREAVAAALGFGDGLHAAASAQLLALHEAKLKEERARLEAIARRQSEREAREAAVAFGGALHEAALAGAPVHAEPPSFVNGVGMKMIRIKPGRFRMGSPNGEKGRYDDEGPQHEVEISKAFYLAECKVTQEQYKTLTGKNPSWFSADGGGKEKVQGLDTSRFPVETVSWHEAVEFCRLLSELPEEKRAGRVYRLPTEAEWEYAARAGTTTRFHFGDDPGERLLGDSAWYSGNSGGRTHPVREKRPNPWELYDMSGLLWEWCSDGKRKYEAGFIRYPISTDSGGRVLRAGSWDSIARDCRAADRSGIDPGYRGNYIGFRVACRQSEREAREAAVAFGGALHEAALAGAPVHAEPPSFVNGVGMKMIRIKPGRFRMGSPPGEKGWYANEGVQHEVEISKVFYLAECKVTQEQYTRLTGKSPSWFSKDGPGKEMVQGLDTSQFPVERVSWEEAVEFCRLLSELPEEKRAGRVYRLPTEADWEYAARAGTTTRFHFGDDLDYNRLGDYAWYAGNSGERTHPVRGKRPNPWGLYDMGGLLWEWCSDGKSDPVGPERGAHLIRGGSWVGDARNCRAASRNSDDAGSRVSYIGFRVACSPPR
jgi:formylglycine-generating enzyme required for sulfatase activity